MVIYGLCTLVGLIIGGGLAWLLSDMFARSNAQEESRRRALAEERNFRIPTLEASVAEKDEQLAELRDHVAALEEKLAAQMEKTSEKDRELFEKAGQIAEKTVQLSTTRAKLASLENHLDEKIAEYEGRLAEMKRLYRDKLELLNGAQARLWSDFRELFTRALDEEMNQTFPKLVRTVEEQGGQALGAADTAGSGEGIDVDEIALADEPQDVPGYPRPYPWVEDADQDLETMTESPAPAVVRPGEYPRPYPFIEQEQLERLADAEQAVDEPAEEEDEDDELLILDSEIDAVEQDEEEDDAIRLEPEPAIQVDEPQAETAEEPQLQLAPEAEAEAAPEDEKKNSTGGNGFTAAQARRRIRIGRYEIGFVPHPGRPSQAPHGGRSK